MEIHKGVTDAISRDALYDGQELVGLLAVKKQLDFSLNEPFTDRKGVHRSRNFADPLETQAVLYDFVLLR